MYPNDSFISAVFPHTYIDLQQIYAPTFDSASASDEEDDEDDEGQQQETREHVSQRQEKVVSLVWHYHVDDSG